MVKNTAPYKKKWRKKAFIRKHNRVKFYNYKKRAEYFLGKVNHFF